MSTARLFTMSWVVLSLCAFAQDNKPAAEFAQLLNMRFYDQSGGFMVEQIQLVFPPSGEQPIELVLSTSGGDVVETIPLSMQKWDQFPVFCGLAPKGHPGIVHLNKEGEFMLAVHVGGEAVTKLPYKLVANKSGDAFNPQTSYVREGPWGSLAYFGVEMDQPDDALTFNWWASLREVPGGKSGAKSTVHVIHGGKEVGLSESAVVVSAADWQNFARRLVQPKSAGGKNFTMAEVSKLEGPIEIVVKVDDTPVKTFHGSVKGGELQRLSRCDLNTQPHTDFISPRRIDTSSGSNSRYEMVDAYWVSTEK